LRESDIAQCQHHAGTGEGFGKEQYFGVTFVDGLDDILPEADRLGVRIVDSERRDTGADPEFQYSDDFALDTGHVLVEIYG
jgi:hypothetical protein